MSLSVRAARGRGPRSAGPARMVAPVRSRLASLLDRSPAVRATDVEAREAIELAVGELIEALRHHHSGTADHSNRLAADCHAVGVELGLAADLVFEIELVAILHDIGKLAVPAAILDLPRPLASRERAVVHAHTIRGAEILTEIAGLRHLAPLVRASHERWDGTGYPDGLRGDRIPLPARVVFTVDAFDAMTNDRPYRRALGLAEARRRISAGARSAFDPRVVRALLAAVA